MPLYNIGYYTHDGNITTVLFHEEIYTKNEITEKIAEATHQLITNEQITKPIDFETIYYNVIEYLKTLYGFKEPNYGATWEVYGWDDLYGENEAPKGSTLQKLQTKLTLS